MLYILLIGSIKENLDKGGELLAFGVTQDDNFINKNYVFLEEENKRATAPNNRQSISSRFLMGKSDNRASEEKKSGEFIEMKIENEHPEESIMKPKEDIENESCLNNKIIKFKKFPYSEMESILDLNHIHSQISEVNKNLENIKKIHFLDDPSFFSRESPISKRFSPESKGKNDI